MGTDDLLKNEERQESSVNMNTKHLSHSFLIVTEGERTEPLYFQGLKKLILEKVGGTVNVVEIPHIDVRGEGVRPEELIEKTDQIVKEAKIIYQNIWILFDKDDFEDFDSAIEEVSDEGIRWHGAISLLNIGYICIFIIQILRFTGRTGIRN